MLFSLIKNLVFKINTKSIVYNIESEYENIYIETDVDEMDVTSLEQVERVLTNSRPDMVVHMAAYTNVNLAETSATRPAPPVITIKLIMTRTVKIIKPTT